MYRLLLSFLRRQTRQEGKKRSEHNRRVGKRKRPHLVTKDSGSSSLMAMNAVAPAASTAFDSSLQMLLPAVVDVVDVLPYPSLAADPGILPLVTLTAVPLLLALLPPLLLPPETPSELTLTVVLMLVVSAASTLASNTWPFRSGEWLVRVRGGSGNGLMRSDPADG